MEYINGNDDRRHFIVAKQGRDVFVREVEKGSCSFTLTREQAWTRAQSLRVFENCKKKTIGSRLIFTALDMTQTDLPWPEAKEENSDSGVDIMEDTCNTTPMPSTTANFVAPTEKQIALFNKLCTELQDAPYTAGFAATVDRKAASAAIDAAIKATQEAKRAQTQPIQPLVAPDVPAGRYAVTDNEGTLRFFKLDRPTEGRWAGYTFLKMMASDEAYPVRDRTKRDRILSKIAQDPREAMLTYGREIGACGHCGRTLTDENSRNAGIGPVCAGRMGW